MHNTLKGALLAFATVAAGDVVYGLVRGHALVETLIALSCSALL